MCSRYRVKNNVAVIVQGKAVIFDYKARYNAAPSQDLPAVFWNGTEVQGVQMRWGWQPAWSKQLLINAQAETVHEKPTYKNHLHQTCIIPADGFYEWTPAKQPIMFTKLNEETFCFAGLWQEAEGQKRFIVLTTTPNETVKTVHNRMPFIVQPSQYELWLSGEFLTVLQAPDKQELKATPVQRELNNVRNEGAELIRPAPIQRDLI